MKMTTLMANSSQNDVSPNEKPILILRKNNIKCHGIICVLDKNNNHNNQL